MTKLWRTLALALLVGVIASAAVKEALAVSILPNQIGTPNGSFETTVFTSNSLAASNFGEGTVLYGFKVLASSASAVCGLYDAITWATAIGTQGRYIDEGGEATQWDTYESAWIVPYRLGTGLTVITNAQCTVYHDVRQ